MKEKLRRCFPKFLLVSMLLLRAFSSQYISVYLFFFVPSFLPTTYAFFNVLEDPPAELITYKQFHPAADDQSRGESALADIEVSLEKRDVEVDSPLSATSFSSYDDQSHSVNQLGATNSGLVGANSPLTAYGSGCADDDVILEKMLANYDKYQIPGGGNVSVDVEIWVQEVSKIKELTSEFELDVYVTEIWTDPSLAFAYLNPCKQNISFDGSKVLPQIWNPIGCFVNSKEASVHRSPFSNIFLQIYQNGSVWHNYRIKLTGPCENTLRTFPIDQQKCMLFYESFSHNSQQVRMAWSAMPITILKENITLPDYVLVDFKASSVQRLYPSGLWNELVATFTFQRLYGFYILQVYIPAYISVFMSWISFYLGPKNTPSRTMIGVNSLLSLTYQFGSVVNNLPKTSDVKAIDVMILMAMGFIFATLIELGIVGYLTSKETEFSLVCDCSWFCTSCPEWTANKIDKVSAVIFPILFVVFNLWYWFIFMRRGG